MISSSNSELEELAKLNFNSINGSNINISSNGSVKSSNAILPEIQKRGGSNYNNRNSQKEKYGIISEFDGKKRMKGEELLKVVDKLQNENFLTLSNNGESGKK